MHQNLITIRQASDWASGYLSRPVSLSNIAYLINYGKIRKYGNNGATLIDVNDLKKYYSSINGSRELVWKKKLGDDLNWTLSFDHLREKDTTKHVHRLHPYKGKFIPQLVEYFIDRHTDEFKLQVYFKEGDILLDPFSGSGTTLVQANEAGMHSVGIDISRFNCMITEVKLLDYDLDLLAKEIKTLINKIVSFETDTNITRFEIALYNELNKFNSKYFPSPKFKYDLNIGKIDEDKYSREKESKFLVIYNNLLRKFNIQLKQDKNSTFLDKWYIKNVRREIDFAFSLIKKINEIKNKKILAVILSRTIRSCRATTHSDLATLIEPQIKTYYCYKHKKICKPLFSIKYWFARYANDTLSRLQQFKKIKTSSRFAIISSDSRTINIEEDLKKRDKEFYENFMRQRISGIFTSPPYVGQIDYHEQHAYAYDLFGFKRKDEQEIGPLYKGQGEVAKKSYIEGVAAVLLNCKKYLAQDFNIFLVANDKYNLYPRIAEKSGLKIVNRFKRPVLNRTERDKSPYSEIIFHLKQN